MDGVEGCYLGGGGGGRGRTNELNSLPHQLIALSDDARHVRSTVRRLALRPHGTSLRTTARTKSHSKTSSEQSKPWSKNRRVGRPRRRRGISAAWGGDTESQEPLGIYTCEAPSCAQALYPTGYRCVCNKQTQARRTRLFILK